MGFRFDRSVKLLLRHTPELGKRGVGTCIGVHVSYHARFDVLVTSNVKWRSMNAAVCN